jgi:hypothetical protein
MNQNEAVRGGGDAVQLVREHVVEGIDDVVHGATFDGRRLVVAAGYRLFRLVPDSGHEVDQLETSPSRGGLAFDGRHLWQRSGDHLQQLEPRTGFVLKSIAPGLDDVTGLECLERDLLVLHAGGRSLARVETLDATVVAQLETNAPLRGLGWAGGELWSATAGELLRIDPASGRILARLALPAGIEVCDLTGDSEGRLWCVDGSSCVVRAFARPRSRSAG